MPDFKNKILIPACKILNFPLAKILIGIVLINVGIFIVRSMIQLLLNSFHIENSLIYDSIIFITRIIALISIYWFFIRIYEKREPDEILFRGNSIKKIFFGAIIGLLCIGTVLVINILSGWISVINVHESPDILQGLYYTAFYVLLQDFVFYLILFRITEKYLGTYLTILITGLIFGFEHLFFPEYEFINGIFLFINILFIFSALYLRSRTVWEIFGFHLIYNFIQSIVLGVSIPDGMQSVFTLQIDGPVLLTGDKSGLESSAIAALFCIITGGYLLIKEKRQGKFVLPFWAKTINNNP